MSRIYGTQTNPYAKLDGTLSHDTRTSHHPIGTADFCAVDGEGLTRGSGEHLYVLFGVGAVQIENDNGLTWQQIFECIESQHRPKRAFVGFYLGYDFTQWTKTLPESRARALLTIDGKESRRSRSSKLHGKFLPVDIDGWQVDVLGSKQLSFRRKPCDCLTMKCPHPKGPWIYVNDAGSFFQTSFVNVIDPSKWETPIVSDEEYKLILAGKANRDSARLDDDMRKYNRLENEVLRRVLRDLDTGFKRLDVHLSPRQWYGPGQAAQSWMGGRAHTSREVKENVPEWFTEAARASYFGGWFEIMAHGIIPGTCYEYDINSAYPHIIATIPCFMHGTYSKGTGSPPKVDDSWVLVRAMPYGRPPHSDKSKNVAIGAMLHRDRQGRISRPIVTAGWYWLHELKAAERAGCISRLSEARIFEWVAYTPCDCPPPLRQVKYLYQMRQEVGKKSSLGKAAKLTANSIYGKCAQSVGSPRFANPIAASLITAGCRTMILDAIATHPGGKNAVVMVATDGVYFLEPHPSLDLGTELGQWEASPKERLTLFKPGVYWDDASRDAIKRGDHPNFKARGISARDFAHTITEIDNQFSLWEDIPPQIGSQFSQSQLQGMGLPYWPRVEFTSSFSMVTSLQALLRNDWSLAGTVEHNKSLVQSADPADKRTNLWVDDSIPGRRIYRSEPHVTGANAVWRHPANYSVWDEIVEEDYSSIPYEKKFGLEDPFSDENTQAWGITPDEHRPMLGLFRLASGKE